MFQTGYFDVVSLVISGGTSSSTKALSGPTEGEQFQNE